MHFSHFYVLKQETNLNKHKLRIVENQGLRNVKKAFCYAMLR